jgi:hypothetical protein
MDRKMSAIKIDAALLERLHNYRSLTGVSVTHSINEAITDYLEVVVPARLEFLKISQSEKRKAHSVTPLVMGKPKKRVAS